MRQAKPEPVNEAISLTLEMESYLQTANASRVAVVGGEIQEGQLPTPVQAGAPVSTRDDPVRQMLDCMGRFEAKLEEVMISRKAPPPRRQVPVTRYKRRYQPGCWNCGGNGHLQRDCPKPKREFQRDERTPNAVSSACHGLITGLQGSMSLKGTDINIPAFSISDLNYVLEGCVNGVCASILTDTGAAVTLVSKEFWDKVKVDEKLKESMGRKLVGVQGSPLELHGIDPIHIELQGEKFSTEAFVASNLTVDIIVSRDFLREHQCTIKMGKGGDIMHINHRGLL